MRSSTTRTFRRACWKSAKKYRERLVEAAVELDDEVLAKFFDGQEPDEATLKRLIRKAVRHITFIPVLCGSAFKNKGVQPLLDAVVDYLPSPGRPRRHQGRRHGQRRKRSFVSRSTASHSRCSASRSWTIRSSARSRSAASIRARSNRAPQCSTRPRTSKERVGRMLLMHANNREDIKEAYRGRHRRARGPQGHAHRRHAVRSSEAGHSGEDGVPRTRHRNRHRAQVEGGPGEAGRRARQAGGGRSLVPRVDRSGIRPDHPQGHGRTASRHQGRHSAPHLQGRRFDRRAAGGVSREADQEGRDQLRRTRSRRAARVSSPRSSSYSSRPSPARVRRSRPRSSAARCRRNIFPASKKASIR